MTWMKLAETRNFEIPNGTTVDLTALAGNYTESMGWHKPESVKDLTVGQVAFVWSYGDWKRGVVTKIGRTKATVTFVTRTGVDNALARTGGGTHGDVKVTAKAEDVAGLLVSTTPVMTVPSISQGAAPEPVSARGLSTTPDASGRIPALEGEPTPQEDPRDRYFTHGCGVDVIKRDAELIQEDQEAAAPTPANHVLVDPAGNVVKEGDALPGHNFGPGIFRQITRVPGDGTSTGGKIVADWERWAGKEGYPPPGYRIVPAWTLDQTQADVDALLAEALGEPAPVMGEDEGPTDWGQRLRPDAVDLAPGVTVAPIGSPRPSPEDLADLALALVAEDLEHVGPDEDQPEPADPRAVKMDVVTIHRGDRLYEVLQLDAMSAQDGLARVAPCDPEDQRDPQWVSLDLLHVRAPLGSYRTEEITGRIRQTREVFTMPDDSVVVVRTILTDPLRSPQAVLAVAPLGLAEPVAKLRAGEALVVDGRCFRVLDLEGDGTLTLEPARWRARLKADVGA